MALADWRHLPIGSDAALETERMQLDLIGESTQAIYEQGRVDEGQRTHVGLAVMNMSTLLLDMCREMRSMRQRLELLEAAVNQLLDRPGEA